MTGAPYPWNWPRFVAEKIAAALDRPAGCQAERIDAAEAAVKETVEALICAAKHKAREELDRAKKLKADGYDGPAKDTEWIGTFHGAVSRHLRDLLDTDEGPETPDGWTAHIWEIKP